MKVEFITGQAGTGKTFEVMRRMAENPSWGKLCATTGIAAINLGGLAVTINSLLHYYDVDSLREAVLMGRLDKSLRGVAIESGALVLDEVSMMGGEVLDIIYSAVHRVNEMGSQLDLVITGDFAQLPPIDASWAFTAKCWPEFERNTTWLTKVWRQSDPSFLSAINAARKGNGVTAVKYLRAAGVKFHRAIDPNFEGTTIFGANSRVDRYNKSRLDKLKTPELVASNYRWGKQRSEWRNNIPSKIILKEGALVMILANDSPRFTYANGDLGTIVTTDPLHVTHKAGWAEASINHPDGPINHFEVQLKRNREKVVIYRITRRNETQEEPSNVDGDILEWPSMVENMLPTGGQNLIPNPDPEPWNEVYFDSYRKRYVVGAVRYFPLRLAYASTVHKTQGLSLDSVQLDVNELFLKEPAMTYVAISRVKTPEGLRIVGGENVFISRVKAAKEVSRWL